VPIGFALLGSRGKKEKPTSPDRRHEPHYRPKLRTKNKKPKKHEICHLATPRSRQLGSSEATSPFKSWIYPRSSVFICRCKRRMFWTPQIFSRKISKSVTRSPTTSPSSFFRPTPLCKTSEFCTTMHNAPHKTNHLSKIGFEPEKPRKPSHPPTSSFFQPHENPLSFLRIYLQGGLATLHNRDRLRPVAPH